MISYFLLGVFVVMVIASGLEAINGKTFSFLLSLIR